MSLKPNIFAGYASQIYISLIGIVILPMYVKYMGVEAYGLVGFFAMLQAWFNVLDLGLTPTVTRETTRFKGGEINALTYRRILRALQLIFIGIGILGGVGLIVSSKYVAEKWLQIGQLPLSVVHESLKLMAIGVSMRWISGIYRACLSGAELLVWLAGANSLIATLRFICVIPVLICIDNSPSTFFLYQFFVSFIELTILMAKVYFWLPKISQLEKVGWGLRKIFHPLKTSINFSLSIAFTASIGVFVTHLDKLILSKIISLESYGYFSLAVVVASGLLVISGPISAAILPRMANLNAQGRHDELQKLYGQATQLVAVIIFPASIILIFFAEQILWIWTNDLVTAERAAGLVMLYAIGNTFLTFSAFPYYLQFAKGDMSMHLLGNAIFAVLIVPLIIWLANMYGAIGAGFAWMASNVLYFLVWTKVVHDRFDTVLHRKWLCLDILPVAIPVIAIGFLLSKLNPEYADKLKMSLYIVVSGLILIMVAIFSSSQSRGYFSKLMINKRYG